ncbi:MAG: hypothetical protein LUD27_07160 [Clostridia bacterium]|nr:hypothetical protein [Clostridia bacterium]
MAINDYIKQDRSNFFQHMCNTPENFLLELGELRSRHSDIIKDGYEDYGMTVLTATNVYSGSINPEVFVFYPGFNRENYKKVLKKFYVQMNDFIATYHNVDEEGADMLNDFYIAYVDHFQNYVNDLNGNGYSITIPNPTIIQKTFVDGYIRSTKATTPSLKMKEFDDAFLLIQNSIALSYAINIKSTYEGNLSLTPKDITKYKKSQQ